MKPKLVLISHGEYAFQLQQSARMIMGEIDGLYTVSMLESDGLEGTKEKLRQVLQQAGGPVVIAADMMAGTPCNVAVHAMYQNENIRVVTGLNLPMAIEYAVADIESLDEMARFLQEVGQDAVKLVEKPELNGDGEEGYED